MNQKKSRVLSWGIICLFLALPLQFSCMMAAALKDQPGIDVSSIKPGISKQEADKILGSPMREWITPLNIHYCVYRYDAGIPPSADDAAVFAFFDIITVGFIEFYEATGITAVGKTREANRVVEKIAISYDANDIIIGVFDHFGDFDVLPDNGHSKKCDKQE